MDEDLEQIVEETEATEEESAEEVEIELGTISAIYGDGVTLVIDGSDSASNKHYKTNTGVKFTVGDRVKIAKSSGSYIVEFPIGNPNSNLVLPSGGSDGQLLLKNGSTSYSVKWGNILDIFPSGQNGQFLQRTSSGIAWANVTADTDRLKYNNNNEVILTSNALYPSSSGVSLGRSYDKFNGLYVNGTLNLGDYSTYLGFFGTSPIRQQTLYSSDSLSTVISKLKAYGLFS